MASADDSYITPPCDSHLNILDLPNEVAERIFWHMDEGTFFISLQACRHFLEAGSTGKNLQRQVRRLPGLRSGLQNLHGDEFRRECRDRAFKSGCMAWAFADVSLCQLPSGTIMSKSVFFMDTSIEQHQSACTDAWLAVANDNGTISIYSLADNDVRQSLTLNLNTSQNWDRSTRVSALAFSSKGHLVVLQEQNEYVCESKSEGDLHCCRTEQGLGHACKVQRSFELMKFRGCINQEPSCSSRSHILPFEGEIPMGLALADSGKASIAWKMRISEPRGIQYRIELVTTSENLDMDPTRADDVLQDVDNSVCKSLQQRLILSCTTVEQLCSLLNPIHNTTIYGLLRVM